MSVLADMTARIGGDRVAVTALVPANADAHVYEPNPTDVKSIAAARLKRGSAAAGVGAYSARAAPPWGRRAMIDAAAPSAQGSQQ